jgi:hypothetical protein
VHVRLPLPWIEHQFMFNSFVIEDAEQARLIAAMKLPQLFCDPARCKVLPLPDGRSGGAAETVSLWPRANDWQPWQPRAWPRSWSVRGPWTASGSGSTRPSNITSAPPRAVGGAIKAFVHDPREAIREVARVSEESTAAAARRPG